MRIFIAAAALGILVLPQAVHSQQKAGTGVSTSAPAETSPADQASRSDAMAKEARDKIEALERSRDRKMRAISKGICSGC